MFWILSIIFLALVIGGGLMWIFGDKKYGYSSIATAGCCFCIIGIMCVLIFGIVLITDWNNNKANIERFKSTKQTIEMARVNTNVSDMEKVKLLETVIGDNAWLAETKYWNSTSFGFTVPDEVETLTPIQ